MALSYQPFDELISQLRADNHTKIADELDDLLHRVAWTTSSELVGELGLKILTFHNQTERISPKLQRSIEASMKMVREVWPSMGR